MTNSLVTTHATVKSSKSNVQNRPNEENVRTMNPFKRLALRNLFRPRTHLHDYLMTAEHSHIDSNVMSHISKETSAPLWSILVLIIVLLGLLTVFSFLINYLKLKGENDKLRSVYLDSDLSFVNRIRPVAKCPK